MNLKDLNIGVLFGGPSGEYKVSCHSAETIVKALSENGYKVFPVGVSKDGRWYGPIPFEDVKNFDAKNYQAHELIMPQRPGHKLYKAENFEVAIELDVFFPIIHGSYGEDGRIQAFFDMCRIPYVGSGFGGSVVGMDKVFMRDILAAHGIAQTDYVAVRRYDVDNAREVTLDKIEAALPYPVFVKPASLGSSVGISRVTNRSELSDALVLAGQYDMKILAERGVNAREIETALLGNYEVEVAPPGEVMAAGNFYDYESKYILEDSRTIVPADLTEEQVASLKEIGTKVYDILGLSGMCRADFFIDRDSGEILLNEVNTLPGFTSISMYAMMWKATNRPLIDVIERLLVLAFERNEDVMRNYTVLGE